MMIGGSSPRGRGTPRPSWLLPCVLRFIPARAGNAPSAAARSRRWTVHPRAGGERNQELLIFAIVTGSSPRGRGTLLERRRNGVPIRFIPARAGNANPSSSPRSFSSVHPRAGGERNGSACRTVCRFGSSPRGRGTLLLGFVAVAAVRFIPARAGNAAPHMRGSPAATVHPRAGGERTERSDDLPASSGSSPRGRGTPGPPASAPGRARFIPARAGNAGRCGAASAGGAVHPRAGGERDAQE